MLIVDDDIRNIFSLTSVLESHDVEVLHAERGKDGILILEQTPGVDVALIDIMMPEMDGYETMQQIRKRPELADLPLIAVTAKAMKGDRQKCLDAGASDYIAKPVDIELLLALLRVWVARSRERPRRPRCGDGGRGVGDERLRRRDARCRPAPMPSGLERTPNRSGRAFSSSTTTSATCSPFRARSRISAKSSPRDPARRRCATC